MSITTGAIASAANFNAAFVSKSSAQTIDGGKVFNDYIGTDWEDVATSATIAALSSANSAVRMTGSTTTTIQGITAGQDGQIILIYNASSATVTLAHQNGTASAANRMILPSSIDYTLSAGFSIELIYDATQARWVIKSASGTASASTFNDSRQLDNLAIAASVAANAMTIAIKTKAGSDATGGDYISVGFRSSTATSGVFVTRTITSSLSTVISSGSTAGSTSGMANWVYVYLIDNAGTVEVAWSGTKMADEGSLVSTTAEGGAGAADSKTTLYSTTARSNVACRLVGRIKSTQATAGTWASSPSEISLAPFDTPSKINVIHLHTGNGHGSSSTTVRRFSTTYESIGSAMTYADSSTDGMKITINEDGLYGINYSDTRSGSLPEVGIVKNPSSLTSSPRAQSNGLTLAEGFGPSGQWVGVSTVVHLYAGDIIRAMDSGSNDGTDNACIFRIEKIL